MKIRVDKKAFQSVTGIADWFSALGGKERRESERTLILTASDGGGVHMEVNVRGRNTGIVMDISGEDMNLAVEAPGRVDVFSDWVKTAVENIDSDEVVLETVDKGFDETPGSPVRPVLRVTDSSGAQQVDLDTQLSEDLAWDTPPETDGEEYFTCRAPEVIEAFSAVNAPGIPLLNDSVFIHPEPDRVVFATAESHPYVCAMSSVAPIECEANQDMTVHALAVPVVVRALSALTDETSVVAVGRDGATSRIIYTVYREDRMVARMWGPEARAMTGGPSYGFRMIRSLVEKQVASDPEARVVLSVDKGDFLSAAKSALNVGMASGALVDEEGKADRTSPVRVAVAEEEVEVSSMQKTSSYTRALPLSLESGCAGSPVVFRLALAVAEPFLTHPMFTSDEVRIVLVPMGDNYVGMVFDGDPATEFTVDRLCAASVTLMCSTKGV